MSSSSALAGCCCSRWWESAFWLRAGLLGDGEFGWSRDITATRLGIIWRLPKVWGENLTLVGGGAWPGVFGGDGEVGALCLLVETSIWVGSILSCLRFGGLGIYGSCFLLPCGLGSCYNRFSSPVGRWNRERFGGRRDLDYSAPRVQWLHTLLRGKAEAQGSRLSNPEKKGTRPIGNSRGIAVRVGRLLSGSGKVLDTFLCPLHESGLVEGERM